MEKQQNHSEANYWERYRGREIELQEMIGRLRQESSQPYLFTLSSTQKQTVWMKVAEAVAELATARLMICARTIFSSDQFVKEATRLAAQELPNPA